MLTLILFLIYIQSYQTKNLLFPFKKLTIEYLNSTKSISDFIDFNIYTNITMGTPSKNVGHFINNADNLFYYSSLALHYTGRQDYEKIQKEIENSISFYYFAKESSSHIEIDDYDGLYSDTYLLYDLNQEEKNVTFEFNANPIHIKDKLFGSLNLLYNREREPDANDRYLFSLLKQYNLIDNSYFTFFYGEYDLSYEFNYLNDNYNFVLGNFIIGEYPHEFSPEKYKQDDQIKLNGQFVLNINEIKFKYYKILNYSELDVRLSLKFDSDFLKGSIYYKNETDKIFFNDLFQKKLCKEEIVKENIIISERIVYSCENNKEVQEKIKTFPTLYLEIKEYNLTFLFNYKELFKLHNNRLYFLVSFKNNSETWDVGEIFFRKYLTSFDYYSKTIAFYTTQIDNINKKTDIVSPDEPDSDDKSDDPDDGKDNLKIRIIIYVVVGVVIIAAIVIITLLLIKLKKNRKKRARELNDDYEYIPENKVN